MFLRRIKNANSRAKTHVKKGECYKYRIDLRDGKTSVVKLWSIEKVFSYVTEFLEQMKTYDKWAWDDEEVMKNRCLYDRMLDKLIFVITRIHRIINDKFIGSEYQSLHTFSFSYADKIMEMHLNHEFFEWDSKEHKMRYYIMLRDELMEVESFYKFWEDYHLGKINVSLA